MNQRHLDALVSIDALLGRRPSWNHDTFWACHGHHRHSIHVRRNSFWLWDTAAYPAGSRRMLFITFISIMMYAIYLDYF